MRNILSAISIRFSVILLSGIVICLCQNSYAQSSIDLSSYKPGQLKRLAHKCEIKHDYYTALELMEEYYRKEKENDKAVYYLAELYRKSKQYDSAIVFYSLPLLSNDKKFPLRKFRLAELKMITQEYEEAKNLLVDFRRRYKGENSKDYRKLARNFIAGCDSALRSDTNTVTAFVSNLGTGVNTSHIEFSPFPLGKDIIIYGSLPLDTANVFSHSRGIIPVRELFIAEKKGRVWQSSELEEFDLNDPGFNTGNASLSPDGNRLYFTRCTQNWKYQTICQIYVTENAGGGWTEPQKLYGEVNLENYTSTQPTIGSNPKDGTDIIYFVSDRPGGKGGLDIWFAQFDNRKGIFKSPKNLGSRVNTCGDDITPHFNTATQSLYFSSDGLSGFGGFDIFKVKGWGRTWEEAINVGIPVNSSYNDYYLSLNPDGNSGYFTSNRPGSQLLNKNTCCDDIYFFNWKLPQTIPAKGLVYNNSDGQIIDLINEKFETDISTLPQGKPLDDVTVFLYQVNDNGDRVFIQSEKTKDGYYNFSLERDKDYSITIKNYGYFDKVVTASTKRYLSEDTLILRNTGISYVPDIELVFYVYYETGKYRLTQDNMALLDSTVFFLMDMLPTSIVEISSHTDNVGKEDFNQKLSQKRAELVVEYLIENGIFADRLVARGYGMSQPLEPNAFPDGTDNPEGRKRNRRTQLKIIGNLSDEVDQEEL